MVKNAEKRTRAEKHEDTLKALVSAAIEVVGEEGYATASVVKITSRANVANGTFYNYFANRQDLFDQLLPLVGDRLIKHIKSQVRKDATGIDRERMRITAYFDFFKKTPGFIRIFHEAEVFAPKAYERHVQQYYTGYVRALRKNIENGELRGFSNRHIDTLAFLLMGMQDYLGAMLKDEKKMRTSTAEMIEVYLKLISEGGLYAGTK